MNIKLSDHFTYKRLLRFVLPSIGMMIFTSIYGMVDGFFVSNFVGKTEFAAVNLIMPFPMMLGAGIGSIIFMKIILSRCSALRHSFQYFRKDPVSRFLLRKQRQLLCTVRGDEREDVRVRAEARALLPQRIGTDHVRVLLDQLFLRIFKHIFRFHRKTT